MLDSIQFVHFDDYNNLTLADYKTIGFTQLPSDVAFIGSLLLNGDQQMINETFQPSDYITISHIANYSSLLYDGLVAKAESLKALHYQINILNWPMEIYSYKKSDNRISQTILNRAPRLNRTFMDLTAETDQTLKIYIPESSFKDSDTGDHINYALTIGSNPLPEWATYDTVSHYLELTPAVAKTYTVAITATDNHLSFSNASFKVKVTAPDAVENIETSFKFKVYPNPAMSEINIESPVDMRSSYSVNLYNMFGELMYSGYENRNAKMTIDLSEFSESVIFLTITNEGGTECQKIIRY
jgi:hypothetical protein